MIFDKTIFFVSQGHGFDHREELSIWSKKRFWARYLFLERGVSKTKMARLYTVTYTCFCYLCQPIVARAVRVMRPRAPRLGPSPSILLPVENTQKKKKSFCWVFCVVVLGGEKSNSTLLFYFYFLILQRKRKNKVKLCSPHFHVFSYTSRASIEFNCIRNPTGFLACLLRFPRS